MDSNHTSKVSRMTPFCLTWAGLQKYLHNSVSKHAKAYVEWANKTLFKDEIESESLPECPPEIVLQDHEQFKGLLEMKENLIKSLLKLLGLQAKHLCYNIQRDEKYINGVDYMYLAESYSLRPSKKL
eukprot:Pgem_evm3s14806